MMLGEIKNPNKQKIKVNTGDRKEKNRSGYNKKRSYVDDGMFI